MTDVRDQTQQEIDRALMLGGFAGVLRDGGGVRSAGKTRAGANELTDDQPRRQRESRDDLEINQRLHADAANLFGVVDMGDARRHRAEDDWRDGHFDQLDEAIAQRPNPIPIGVFGREPAKQHAKRDGREHLRIKLAMEGCFGGDGGGIWGGLGDGQMSVAPERTASSFRAARSLIIDVRSRSKPFSRSEPEITRGALARDEACRKSRLQQIAAGRRVEIQHFAGEKNAGALFQHQRGVEFVEADAARGGNRPLETGDARDAERNILDKLRERLVFARQAVGTGLAQQGRFDFREI